MVSSENLNRLIPRFIVILAIAIYAAICLHSVEETHYLKSFFPKQFTVKEAFYASLIELIKISLIGIPFLLVIAVCLFLMRMSKTPPSSKS